MNNLRIVIDVIFRKIPIGCLFTGQIGLQNKHYLCETAWYLPEVKHLLMHSLNGYSPNDIENVLLKLREKWAIEAEQKTTSSVFFLLAHFTKQALCTIGNAPVVEYSHLLRWRELTHCLGEDLFTCSYLAWQDSISRHHRTFFAWRPVLATNNLRLQNLLHEGVAENHFHLQGSAPHSDLSWLSLMNKVTSRKQQFDKFLKEGKLTPDLHFGKNDLSADLYVLTMKAAYIRLFLFLKINGLLPNKQRDICVKELYLNKIDFETKEIETKFQSKEQNDFLFSPHQLNDFLFESNYSEKQLLIRLNVLQEIINSNRICFGKIIDPSSKVSQPDYWLSKDLDNQNLNGNEMLCGERMFLYECFRLIKIGDSNFRPLQDLFYTYLVIKSKFREEMIQVNNLVGFANFSTYQKRKTIFLENRDIYQRHIYRMAIHASISNQTIRSFEARISPQKTTQQIKETICSIDAAALGKSQTTVDRYLAKQTKQEVPSFFYVHHFIKEKDKARYKKDSELLLGNIQCRHHHLRKSIEKQAKAIAQLREGISNVNDRIAGIDAAASELHARPEVFAQAFRYLKYYRNKGTFDRLKEFKLQEIKATFHAGEDFYDLVDGLRAIDEAIKFLNLSEGDRLGHALALGVDTRDYYTSKQLTIMIPKQWHLDNICWLISRIRKYNLHQFSTFASHLEWHFQTLYHEIFQDYEKHKEGKTQMTTELYYEAWKLRGDNPFIYQPDGERKDESYITFWEKSGENQKYPVKGVIRYLPKVNQLYYHYHFNPEVKKKGNEIKQFEITPEYIKLVEVVQKCFQQEISQKHLGIETNPSSNYLIGTFKRYDKHPLIRFFNLGLETDPEKIRNCPQLFVSINTDDQGVFNTYLENEYALMALALEKMKDDDGKPIYNSAMIYDWLDRIRRMGLEMSFKKDQGINK